METSKIPSVSDQLLNMGTESSRRQFLKSTLVSSAAAAATMGFPQNVFASGTDKIRVGLIGCGGRGTGAAIDALHADPQAELTAVGDTFKDRIESSVAALKADEHVGSRVTVEKDHYFDDFDAYKNVIDNVDVVILAEPPHFRAQHLEYAIQQGKHCFVEKPVAVDVPGVRKVEELCKLAKEKRLSVVSGLCWRYDKGVQETIDKIQNGAVGDIVAIESTYNASSIWYRTPQPEWSQMENQLRNWYYHTWLSGDHIVEQAVHSIDKTAWLLGDIQPIKAFGLGGRQQRVDPKYGNIFDHHTVFYEYPNGVKVFFTCRQQDNTSSSVEEHVMGTTGRAKVIANKIEGQKKWRFRGPNPNMYRAEHAALFKSIRDNSPINDGHYMCNSTLIAIMGRACSYTGLELTWEKFAASNERLGPTNYAWGDIADTPVAIPGVTKFV